MKQSILIYLFVLLISHFAHSQVSQIEKNLNKAEEELIQLELKMTTLETDLANKGLSKNDSPEYIQLKSQQKTKKKQVRFLRREYKNYQKQQQQIAVNQVPNQTNNSKTPVANKPVQANQALDAKKIRKNEIKALKTEVKELKRKRKDAISAILAQGQNPMMDSSVQELDQLIASKELELAELKSTPLPTSNNNHNQPVTNQNKPQIQPQTPVNPVPTQTPNIAVSANPTPDIGLTTILFPKFSSEINEDYNLYLNFVAQQMQTNTNLLLTIDAYTDDSEKNKVSMQLTEKMANNAAQAFVNRGINPQRLIIKAHGSKNSVGDNKTFFGQARNRRVELGFTYSLN